MEYGIDFGVVGSVCCYVVIGCEVYEFVGVM